MCGTRQTGRLTGVEKLYKRLRPRQAEKRKRLILKTFLSGLGICNNRLFVFRHECLFNGLTFFFGEIMISKLKYAAAVAVGLMTLSQSAIASPGGFPNPVPEPGTLALVGLAAAVAFVLRKKK